jgi:hypothetical protein
MIRWTPDCGTGDPDSPDDPDRPDSPELPDDKWREHTELLAAGGL